MKSALSRLTTIVLFALVTGCSSPPKLKFPTGENRIPINATKPALAASAADAASPTTASE